MICDSYTDVQIGTKWEEFQEEDMMDGVVQRRADGYSCESKKGQ